jgi:hypothetical protein
MTSFKCKECGYEFSASHTASGIKYDIGGEILVQGATFPPGYLDLGRHVSAMMDLCPSISQTVHDAIQARKF